MEADQGRWKEREDWSLGEVDTLARNLEPEADVENKEEGEMVKVGMLAMVSSMVSLSGSASFRMLRVTRLANQPFWSRALCILKSGW